MESIGIDEAMRNRHSVRKYQDKPLEEHAVRELQKVIDTCNAEGHLKFQMVTGSKGAFEGLLARSFDGVSNYVALVKKKDDPDEKVGYYGEKVVLHAQMLGMNTCWVGLTYSKRKLDIHVGKDEKLVCVLPSATVRTRAWRTRANRWRSSAAATAICLSGSGMAWRRRCSPPLR